MNELFALAMPWWHFAVRGAITYLGLLILLRCTGKRAFGEMSPFDIVVLILVGGALRSAIVGNDSSLLGPFIGIATILALDRFIGFVASRSPAFDRLIEGRPLLLVRAGRLVPGALRRASVPPAAFERELRLHEVASVAEVDSVRLEPNGRLSVLRRAPSSASEQE
jgi:uncharacterized membrane protein YcaP (DUF421 family)